MTELPAHQAQRLLNDLFIGHESKTLEFKRIAENKAVRKLLEATCAFANTDGGVIAVGMEDERKATGIARLYGVEENPEALDEFVRKLGTHFDPPIKAVDLVRLPCFLRDGSPGHLVLVHVRKSDKVHSLVDDGTWTRLDASNREMSASEILELSYRRGVRSAESEPVTVNWTLLDTPAWSEFAAARGFGRTRQLADQMAQIGLAEKIGKEWVPRRAAVLLFAEEPGGLLATVGTRAEVRLTVYRGKIVEAGARPNMKKPPVTIHGPLIRLIDEAVRLVLNELAEGVELASSGFKTRHRYPERVVKEAIVNAVIHRDYRLNRDIEIRIFDDRLEVESPGVFPGAITPANIARAGSKARNPLIARTLRDFPTPPNFDLNEGVPMMFAEMAAANLYPPQYKQSIEITTESVTVTLLNMERPTVWDEISNWIDRNGAIANADLCRIAEVDTLKASKMLKAFVEEGILESLPGRAKRNAAYVKPNRPQPQQALLPDADDN